MARVAASGRVASTRNNSVLYNGGFEVKPAYTADTNVAGRWIDGTAAGSVGKTSYGWAAPSAGSGIGANAAAAFDTSQFRSGTASLRVSNLNASGAGTITSYRNSPTAAFAFELLRLSANTSYTLVGYIRTNNAASNAAFIDLREFSATITTLATTSTNKLSGTDTSFRQVTLTVTTNASTVFGAIFLRNSVAGNTSDVWFDDITLVSNAGTGRSAASGRLAI